jgi:integrase
MAQGSLVKKGDRYYGVFYVGSKQVWRALKTSIEREAHKRLREVMRSLDTGRYRETASLTFLSERYLYEYAEVQIKRGKLQEFTRDAYRSMLTTHLRPFFGNMRLTAMSPAVVRHFTAEKAEALGRKALKPKTYNNILTFLKSMLTWGVRVGYLATNPADEERATLERHEMDFLTPEEIRRLIAHSREPYATLVYLAIFTGLRRGELLALQWGDVDWNRRKLRVRRTLYRGTFTRPKTPNAVRDVDLSPRTVETLRLCQIMYPPLASDLVFRTRDDHPLDPDNLVKRVFRPTLARAGIRRIRFHDLRHTYATLLINQGANIKYISKQMGHASVQITLDRYGHLLPDTGREEMQKLDRVMDGEASNGVSNVMAGASPKEPSTR